jgi:hypothetical protein
VPAPISGESVTDELPHDVGLTEGVWHHNMAAS